MFFQMPFTHTIISLDNGKLQHFADKILLVVHCWEIKDKTDNSIKSTWANGMGTCDNRFIWG